MEVLFAVAGCLCAFALGFLARSCGVSGGGQPPQQQDLPPGLARQWDDFLSYTGGAEGGGRHED